MKEDMSMKIINNVLKSQHRITIFAILLNPKNKKKLTISNIHKGVCHLLEQEFDYKNTYKHILVLKKAGLVEMEKADKEQGKPIYVTVIDPEAKEMFFKFLKAMKPHVIEELDKMDSEENGK